MVSFIIASPNMQTTSLGYSNPFSISVKNHQIKIQFKSVNSIDSFKISPFYTADQERDFTGKKKTPST